MIRPVNHTLACALLLIGPALSQTPLAQEQELPLAAVVKIRSAADGLSSTGTGFVVQIRGEDAYIVTAQHVVDGDKTPGIEFHGTRGEFVPGEAVRLDPQSDVALLKVRGKLPTGLAALKFGSAKELKGGEELLSVGFPQGAGEWAVLRASFAGRKNTLLTVAGIAEEGSSGGPLLRSGALVGMVTARQAPFAYAVPAHVLQELLNNWGVTTLNADEWVAPSERAGTVIAGRDLTCELASDGKVRCRGSTAFDSSPGWFEDLLLTQPLDSFSVGLNHMCGLHQGEAYCLGTGKSGQLGNGANEYAGTEMVAVNGEIKFAQISAGGWHTCALTAGGKAYCWGSGENGRLGDGATQDRNQPTAVARNLRFKSIAAGERHTCAIDIQGAAYCWGGVLGLGLPAWGAGPNVQKTPTPVPGSHKFTRIGAGAEWSCALDSAGKAYCWGVTDANELWGPAAADETLHFSALSVGYRHACALTASGKAYCWGDNGAGQLGDGSETFSPKPVAVAGELSYASISAGVNHTCAATLAGEKYCWGGNFMRQIDSQAERQYYKPVRLE